jgi:predicted dehydrogenase
MTYQREFERKLNIAIVGVGNHCYRNIIPALHYLPVNLAAVCDINEDLAKKTASQFGCRYYSNTGELYKKESLDAVFLCVSARLHPKLAIEAFQAGVHVWLEKPASLRTFEIEEMIQHRKDLVSVVGFKKAFMPSTEKAMEIVNSDQYGQLLSILASYPMTLPENGKEALEQGKSTPWLANGCHPLSLMMAVGGKVSSVTMHRDRNGRGVCLLEFSSGSTGNFHFASGPQPLETYSFYGEDWNLTIENSLRVTLNRGIPFQYNKSFNYVPPGTDSGSITWEPQNCLATLENKALFTQGIYGELKYFCDCVLNGHKETRGSLEFALEVAKVYEAVLLSNGAQLHIL